MIGILTDCRDGTEKEITLKYEIVGEGDKMIFQLLNGVTGYESFYIYSMYTPLDKIITMGWTACVGTKNKYDRLVISGAEMHIALKRCLINVK